MKETVVTLLVWLATALGIAGCTQLRQHPLIGCGVILAAYGLLRFVCNRWDFSKGEESCDD